MVEEVAFFNLRLLLSGAWLETLPSVEAAQPPQKLVEARGTSLQCSPPASATSSHLLPTMLLT